MYDLHRIIAEYYIDAVESGEDLSSGTLAAINTFLKNNDVRMDVVEEGAQQNLSFKLKELIAAKKEA